MTTKLSIVDLDEPQQFRVKLRAFLAARVIPQLKEGKEVTIHVDGNVFDWLATGPHLATNYLTILYGMGTYARAILFYEFDINCYPRLNTLHGDCSITFPNTPSPADAPTMEKWDPIPNIDYDPTH